MRRLLLRDQPEPARQPERPDRAAGLRHRRRGLAENFSQTTQFVRRERGCREECYGTTQSQSLDQAQTTTQLASAEGGAAPEPTVLAGWLVALADNVGATIQTIFQYQRAECLEHCSDEAQVQRAGQQAEMAQTAAARAGRRRARSGARSPARATARCARAASRPRRAARPGPSATASQVRPAVLRAPGGARRARGPPRRGRLRLADRRWRGGDRRQPPSATARTRPPPGMLRRRAAVGRPSPRPAALAGTKARPRPTRAGSSRRVSPRQACRSPPAGRATAPAP